MKAVHRDQQDVVRLRFVGACSLGGDEQAGDQAGCSHRAERAGSQSVHEVRSFSFRPFRGRTPAGDIRTVRAPRYRKAGRPLTERYSAVIGLLNGRPLWTPFWHNSGLPSPNSRGNDDSRDSRFHDPVATDRVKQFLHVLIEPRSYLNSLYLLTAFPLGFIYFLVLTVGMISGAFLSIVGIGLLILLATMVAAWGFALFERELAIGFLGVNVPPLSLPDPELVSPWRLLVRHLRPAGHLEIARLPAF